MGITRMDILSNAPQNIIFHKKSNQTNFGGILSLIFFIIAFVIIIFYLINYFAEDDFSIQYSYYQKSVLDDYNINQLDKIINDDKYNPYFNFRFFMQAKCKDNERTIYQSLGKEYLLINSTNNETIPRNTLLNLRATDIDITIMYKCENEFCIIKEQERYEKVERIQFYTRYNGFFLDHQNKENPFHKRSGLEGTSLIQSFYELKNPLKNIFHWKITKYKTEEGLTKIKNRINNIKEEDAKIYGLINNDKTSESLKNVVDNLIIFHNNTYYRILGQLKFEINYYHFDEYSRTKKSIWNTIANICSLTMTVYNIFSVFVSKFYSSSFDNYTLVEKVIFNQKNQINKINEVKNFELTSTTSDPKTDKLISDSNKEKNSIDKEDENKKEDSDSLNIKDNNVTLPELNCFSFLFNYIYNFNPCKISRQQIISKCNEIIGEYYTIEKIIYNQIIIENLLKDYKWNNSELSKLDNNKLIIQLKNLISNFKKT